MLKKEFIIDYKNKVKDIISRNCNKMIRVINLLILIFLKQPS
jgi:hypothetical protein